MPEPRRIVVVLGPTAGGKSAVAVAIARRFTGEIIGADSMQVYRGLDAGTAKPTTEQRAAVPHHMIDCVELTEPFTVADWLAATESIIADLHTRGRLPVVVGGTNLYLKALLEGMFDGPPADDAFRASLADQPVHKLHAQLMAVDPVAAQRIDRNDRKRIIRALEVQHQTGQPISELQKQWEQGGDYRHNPILIGLRWENEALNRRINARVKSMFEPPGLLEETRRLAADGRLGLQAREALGTKQLLEHLAGRCTLAEAFERVKIETRRYAKTQRTWLKRYRGVHWLDAEAMDEAEICKRACEIVASEPH